MVASLTYGIYDIDMLVTFMLTPLATNSILPVVFAYLLLLYHKASSVGVTILTAIVYILSTWVYWSLYKHLIPLTENIDEQYIYQQFMFKLSSIRACAGFSGLSICQNITQGSRDVNTARHKLRVLTPLIWTFSTFVFVASLGFQFYQWYSKRGPNTHSPLWQAAYWITTIIFLGAIGMQISVLAISLELKMINPTDWKFGQIVAVTVWLPPLLEYIYREIGE